MRPGQNEEELSMNEELSTVNSQFLDKVDELGRANNDIVNLLNSTDVAAVFLDTDLKIRRFTPAIGKLLNLLASDVGRPLGDFSLRFSGGKLLDDARDVLAKLAPLERDVRSEDGRSYVQRILPHRTQDNRIDGVVITFVDITERDRAEAEWRRLATALRDSPDAVTLQDFEGRITAWNRGAELLFGYDAREALGMNVRAIIPESKLGEREALVKRILGGGDVESLETQRLTKDGRLLDIWLTVTPVKDERGRIVALATTQRDITALKEAEVEQARRLDASEQRFRLVAENVPAFFAYVDADERYVFANRMHERLFGISSEEIVGKTVEELVGEEAYAVARPHVARALSGREARYEAAFPIGGRILWLNVNLMPDFDEDGQVKGYFALAVDSTREKRNADAIQANRDHLASVLDTVTDAIVTIDEKGAIDGFNPAAERMFGFTADEAIGRNVGILMPEPYRSEHDAYIQRYLETGETRIVGIGRETMGQRKDGSTFPIDLAVSEVHHQERFTGIIRDITERKRAEEILQQSREELRSLSARLLTAEESERRRLSRELHDDVNQRLAMISVDLETLLQTKGAGDVAARLEELRNRVATLSEDVRSMAYQLHPAILDDLGLAAAVRSLVEEFTEHHGIPVSVRERHFPRRTSKNVASCLYRVVQESLSNIAKHSESPGVDIRLVGTERGVRLSIRDYGVGFEVVAVRNRRKTLGIVSMEERVRMVNGHLAIRSFPGRGTQVRVTITRDSISP